MSSSPRNLMEELNAKISAVVMSNRHTGFYILRVIPEGRGTESVSVLGSYPGVAIGVGLRAKFHGKFETHDKWGKQFRATSCEITPDKGRNGVVTYLSANVPSIGPMTAAKLYDAFGEGLLEILEKTPDKILECSFLSKMQAQAIMKEWSEASELRTASIHLSDLGLSSFQIKSVLTKFGISEARKIAVEDPYRLVECAGISFLTCDNAARKTGIGVDDPRRLDAIVQFCMNEMSFSDGHLYVTRPEIRTFMRKKLFSKHGLDRFTYGEEMSEQHFLTALVSLQQKNRIYADGESLYLGHHWRDENGAAECVAEMIANGPLEFKGLEATIEEFEKAKDVTLSDDQRRAILALNHSRTLVVSGYPGTGKTMLISAFVHLLDKANLDYSLMSPTGIAAKRLSQMTGKPASTIHRALGYKGDGTWEFNPQNKFVVDAVIIDEMSMVDASIFHKLVSSLLPTTLLIMVGDPAQLPSVGAGYVLNSLMKCSDVAHVGLTRIYRQGKASDINVVAHAILNGNPVDTSFRRGSEFMFMDYDEKDVMSAVRKLTSEMKVKSMNFQVIAPVYDGELGVDRLNKSLRGVLNDQVVKIRYDEACSEAFELAAENGGLDKSGRPTNVLLAHVEAVTGRPVSDKSSPFSGLSYDEVHAISVRMKPDLTSEYLDTCGNVPSVGPKDSPTFYEGDRVMIIKNDYEKMVFNGDVGKVQRISLRDDEVEVKVFNWLDSESTTARWIDKVFTFKVDEAKNVLKVAYACTAHKVQGQEFDYVLLPMTNSYGIMLYKNLVYTAITRAKNKVFVFGDPRAFLYATRNDRETSRNTSLDEFISRNVRELTKKSA